MSRTYNPAEMASRGRLGGLAKAARHDAAIATRPAREGFMRRFLDEVDPERALPEQERNRRAEAARKLYFARLARRSAEARKRTT